MTLHNDALELVSKMTKEEKIGLCSGEDFWHTKGVERLGLTGVMLTDGPHGLRKQSSSSDHLGINASLPAVCFPPACASACSFDRRLLESMGKALGGKCRREHVGVLLGPGINIKRNPLCGRNFEYFSEDPYLTGELASSLVTGVQSCGVGTSLKHFAVNNQETRRMTIDSVVDERALREIYLAAFETVVKNAAPWTIMSSYNKVNGTYSSDNDYLLNTILRKEWGYQGLVVSDWGGTNNHVLAINAGMDLEMPPTQDENRLYTSAELYADALDNAAAHVTELLLKCAANGNAADNPDVNAAGGSDAGIPTGSDDDDHNLAGKIAEASAVLLKNENILPICGDKHVAFIGSMAKSPRYQGTGSSRINPYCLDNAYDAAQAAGYDIYYAEGCSQTDAGNDEALVNEAVICAKSCDIAVVFAGLPDSYESEGFDRKDLCMPPAYNNLIEAVASANPNTIAVLQCGAPVLMPWLDKVKAVLLTYLSGEAGGNAAVKILFGETCPSGKLAETWPISIESVPGNAYFPGSQRTVEYRESIYVGYRYYDASNTPVAFPFGFGLSYATFEYLDITVEKKSNLDYTVTVHLKNSGSCSGAEVVQLYIAADNSSIFRAVKELKGFEKIELGAGESGSVTFSLTKRAFAYYNTAAGDWCVESGKYSILIGGNSRNLPLRTSINICGDCKEAFLSPEYSLLTEYKVPASPFHISDEQFTRLLGRPLPCSVRAHGEPYTLSSSMQELEGTLIGKLILKKMFSSIESMNPDKSSSVKTDMIKSMIYSIPVRALGMFSDGTMTRSQIEAIVDLANGHIFKGIKKLKLKL